MNDLLTSLQHRPLLFVGGKGGVGKTTHAASLACRLAAMGRRVLVISTDPAHSLGDVLEAPLWGSPQMLTHTLSAMELDPQTMVEQHFSQVEKTMAAYARPEMLPRLRTFLEASKSSPGAEEAAMLEAICQYIVDYERDGYDHVVFDTAPTGHTLRLLELPQMMRIWTDTLLAQQTRQNEAREAALPMWDKKAGQKMPALMDGNRNRRWQQAVEVLQKRQQLFADAGRRLADSSYTSIVLVMIPEMLPLAETRRTVQQLKHFKLPCQHLIINQIMPDNGDADPFWLQRRERQQKILTQIRCDLGELAQFDFELQAEDIRGIEALMRFGETGRKYPN